MLILAIPALVFYGLQFIHAAINLIFREALPSSGNKLQAKLSVLIPARNEAHNIATLLNDLQKVENPHMEVLVYDDESTDQTAAIVQELAKQDSRIRYIAARELPAGWLGKNHACFQLAQKAKGDYFLFLDADVSIQHSLPALMIHHMQKHHLSLLSIFPFQIQQTPGEKIVVPLMHYILYTLLPLIFVRLSPFKSHVAANGQCMLFDAAVYRKLQAHQQLKAEAAEDIAIAKWLKKEQYKVACLSGDKRIKCRMYGSYKEAIHGFSKNIFPMFGKQVPLALLFALFAAFGFVPISLSIPPSIPFLILCLLTIQICYALAAKQNVAFTLIFAPLSMATLFIIMANALWLKTLKRYQWKERNIY